MRSTTENQQPTTSRFTAIPATAGIAIARIPAMINSTLSTIDQPTDSLQWE